MRRTLLVMAAVAFLAVLFAKPFDFISHYSEHATHASHAINTNSDLTADQLVLTELSRATADSSHIGMDLWMILVAMLGVFTLVCFTLIRRKNEQRKCRQRGLC